MTRIAISSLGDIGEDVASESAIYAMEHLRDFRGDCSFASRVYSIVQCDIRDYLDSAATAYCQFDPEELRTQEPRRDPFQRYRRVLDRIPKLTARETSLLEAIRDGVTPTQWAYDNGLSHVAAIYFKKSIIDKARKTSCYSNIVLTF